MLVNVLIEVQRWESALVLSRITSFVCDMLVCDIHTDTFVLSNSYVLILTVLRLWLCFSLFLAYEYPIHILLLYI